MKKVIKALLLSALVLVACIMLVGCGAKTIDLNDYVQVEFNGYDMAGRAAATIDYENLIAENEKAFGLDEDTDDTERAKVYIAIGRSISGSLDKNSELSNGETVCFEWDIDGLDSLEEKYGVELKFSDLEIEVEGLDEPQALNLFDYVEVEYNGTAPNGNVAITQKDDIPLKVSCEADKASGLKNGDIVTIAVTTRNLDEYALQLGYIIAETEREYIVGGLPYYAASVADIPEETQQKMQKQAEDALIADCSGWETYTLKDIEFVGYYFVSAKDGFTVSPANGIYCVFKLTSNAVGLKRGGDGVTTETGTEAFYSYYHYENIMIEEDGSCILDLSSGKMPSHRIESDYGYWAFWGAEFYWYTGYSDLDSMFNDCVTSKMEKYDYENTCI